MLRVNLNLSPHIQPHEREVVGSIPRLDRLKYFKMVEVAFPLGLWIMGIVLQLARQCQDNGLVKYWLKIVKETWICELSLLITEILLILCKTPNKQFTAQSHLL